MDRVMLREGFGRNDQYLLPNGFRATAMGCVDGNAVARFCDEGEGCLLQSTQEEGHDTKSAVWVSNGRSDEPQEGCVEKGPMADVEEVCFTSTTLPRYHGTDWERCLFWRKSGVLVVMDRLTVKQPGRHVAACTWRSPRYARLTEGRRWETRTEEGVFSIASAEAPMSGGPYPVTEGRDGETARQVSPELRLTSPLDDDRFSAEAPWVLRQWKRLNAEAGQVVDFQNVLFRRDQQAERPNPVLVRPSDAVSVLKGASTCEGQTTEDLAVLIRGSRQFGGLAVEADSGWPRADELYLAGGRRLVIGEEVSVTSEAPVDLVLKRSSASLTGWIRAAVETEVMVGLPDLKAVRLGHTSVATSGNAVRLAVTPGTQVLHCRAGAGRVSDELDRQLTLAVAKQPHRNPDAAAARPTRGPRLPLRSVWTHDGLRGAGRRDRLEGAAP